MGVHGSLVDEGKCFGIDGCLAIAIPVWVASLLITSAAIFFRTSTTYAVPNIFLTVTIVVLVSVVANRDNLDFLSTMIPLSMVSIGMLPAIYLATAAVRRRPRSDVTMTHRGLREVSRRLVAAGVARRALIAAWFTPLSVATLMLAPYSEDASEDAAITL